MMLPAPAAGLTSVAPAFQCSVNQVGRGVFKHRISERVAVTLARFIRPGGVERVTLFLTVIVELADM